MIRPSSRGKFCCDTSSVGTLRRKLSRNVLTDPDLVRALTDNDFIVWGGDVRDSEAYQSKHLGNRDASWVLIIRPCSRSETVSDNLSIRGVRVSPPAR